ncbi:sugar ABC transporter ATP-binding protein [Brevibacillus sp. B_LB10_24]|uniref:sugar ABC transporter ATP-binding protein n=1 Tax=Brevibacillus sp. B_LB10_24 TaxID=3380645 RepID=UPI0038B981B3
MLEVSGICKSYGAKKVLDEISFKVAEGEIHGLVGKNGAGKTTLVKILQGAVDDYEGDVLFAGANINPLRVVARQGIGIYVVPQHAAVIPEFTVAENIFLGIWPETKRGWIDRKKMFEAAQSALDEYKLQLDLNAKAKELSLVNQRKLNMVRALFSKAKLIILDEPTTALSAEERDSLFEFVTRQKEKGTGFIFISHYLEEVLKLCDQITVLRDGLGFTGYKGRDVDEAMLTRLIIGDHVKLCVRENRGKRQAEKVVLACDQLAGPGLNGVSFQLYRGEIIGLIGFPGSGAREVCRSLAGLNPLEGGEIHMDGQRVSYPDRPEQALQEKIVYVSSDRHQEGIVPLLSIKENTTLSILKSKLANRFGRLDREQEKKIAQDYFEQLKVKAHSIREAIGYLSGGNQQKVVISKALSCDPKVLILDEPTVGIDVQSREEILSIIDELTQTGLAVLYHTNDYNELLRVADRLVFFDGGKAVREVANTGFTSEEIVRLRDTSKAGEAS